MKKITTKTAKTHVIKIHIAGDMMLARTVLQEYVMRGACVSMAAEEYVYTMGNESGMVITLINYPRFPKTEVELLDQALDLAELLIVKLYQGSCAVVDYDGDSYFISRRDD